MRETLIVLSLLLMAITLRSCRRRWLRKMGAGVFLLSSFVCFFYMSGEICIGLLGTGAWFFIPWIRLITHTRKLLFPANQRLHACTPPNPSFFPNATEASAGMEQEGFSHAKDCTWKWGGIVQHFRFFYHPTLKTFASVCLCEQENVAFAFISVSSIDECGTTWRTTNYPFAPTLKCSPNLKWNHVPCEKSCFHQILKDHQSYLRKNQIHTEMLEELHSCDIDGILEEEQRSELDYNFRKGILLKNSEGAFRYSIRGLIFLWFQQIRDIIRLC